VLQRLEPDYLFLTGDYLNLSFVRDAGSAEQFNAWARRLRARHGVYAVVGGPPVEAPGQVAALLRGTAVRLLNDELVALDLDGCRLQIVGVSCSRDKEADGATLRRILRCADSDQPTILLYHTPDLMPTAAATSRIDLYLAGHTHGGQLCLPGYGALFTCSVFGKRYEAGPYREGRTVLYVNRGIGLEGLSGPRARFLSRPEVLCLTLTGPRGEMPHDHHPGG
jgi:predicted MPP superfamily phosphohydrolase